jgi:ABC-2 type transport system ATP-binding protein
VGPVEAAIRLKQVSKSFGAHPAVEAISFEVMPGELVGIVGPDGAGKTTLARLAAGALAPTAGKVEPESRGRVGYLTGRFSLYPELTVWENIIFFAKIYGMSRQEAEAAAARLLEWVGLLSFKERLAGALSGGMRQKLALACAVVHQPPTLILDEPTTAVDPVARVDFWHLLRGEAASGRAVLVTTPYMDEAEHCHRVVLLHQGRMLAMGSSDELKARLPYRMVLLVPAEGTAPKRGEVLAAAESLNGQQWVVPLGVGCRVALDQTPTAPQGYTLTEVAPNLEDVYIWLSGAAEEVKAR